MSDIEKLQKQLDMEKKINENNTDAYMKLLHTSQVLEQRINDAIEYIEKNIGSENYINQYYSKEHGNIFEVSFEKINKLLNILKGG